MKRLAIVGAGGHGRVVADTAECCGWETIKFFDDGWPGSTVNGIWSVVGTVAMLIESLQQFDGVVVAIGDNHVRHAKLEELVNAGAPLVSVLHPAAIVSRHAEVGVGSVIFAGVVVNTGARVGRGVILNTGCSIDHDCVLEDGVHISPGARLAGNVRVASMSWIGIGACVKQSICIGSGVMVGAGAAVVDDIADALVVVGVPAKPH